MEQSAGWSYTKKDAHLYDRSKDYGAIRGLLWGIPRIVPGARVVVGYTTRHGSEGVSQEQGKCVCLCLLNILHVRQRSVRQADVPLHFPCLLVKREIAKFISLSLFPYPLSSLRERKGPPLEWECGFFLKWGEVFR